MFLHRKLDEGDLYFVDNRNDRAESVDATFRVSGKRARVMGCRHGRVEAGFLSNLGRTHDGSTQA